jgi:SAM-dependent methyltransferase
VLEIGSGGRPHPRSTVLTDRYAADASHREGRELIRDQRSFVLADGQTLPFRDKCFDYCVCMHVLEHVDEPGLMLSEMQRVSKAGYIETPTELFDWLFAVPPYTVVHKWYVENRDGVLAIARKSDLPREHRFAHLLDFLRREDPHFERWLEKRPQLFTTQYEWEGAIRWEMQEGSTYDSLRADDALRSFCASRWSSSDYFWGGGSWGRKRWLYSKAVHPVWRKLAKRLKSLVR